MKHTAPLIVLSLSLLGGCSIGKRAIPLAEVRSSCDAKQIEVVSDKDNKAVLNVCGVYEDWEFHAFDGWLYKGPSAQQPNVQPLDTDGDGVPDNLDRCPTVAGIATLDPNTNGCPAPVDADADGIPDATDACPLVAGVAQTDPAKNGCPPDADGDGIPDAQDMCPDVMGVASTDPAKNGCPADQDGDGIIDAQDACPDVAGPASTDPAANGCPDGDGDGIPDKVDACPEEKGSADTDPAKHGCKHRVVVTESQIVINEKVEFSTGSARIRSVSNGLLDDVAKVLKENPRIQKVEVQGHTDNVGSASLNKRLSQQRAEAVMAALIKRGVEKERLSAKGYGMDKPIADNETDEGKATNRRVQFIIVEQTKKPSGLTPLQPVTPAPPAAPAAPPAAAAPPAPDAKP